VLIVELHAIIGSGDVAGVRDALSLTIGGINAKVWVSFFCERHTSLEDEGNIRFIAFGFCNGKAKVDGANEVLDLSWSVWGRVYMKDSCIFLY
jgi:hypothetical protein